MSEDKSPLDREFALQMLFDLVRYETKETLTKMADEGKSTTFNAVMAGIAHARTGQAAEVENLEQNLKLEKSRLKYVLDFLDDHSDDIECRADEDCDHCVILAMIQDQKDEDSAKFQTILKESER